MFRVVMNKTLVKLFIVIYTFTSFSVQPKELIVGLAELDYAPFYFEKDNQFHGAALEIAEEIATSLGHKLVFKRFPWKRVQAYLRSGTIDMMILYIKTPERAVDVIYTEIPHIFESSDLFILNEANVPYINSVNDVLSYKFGNVRGYTHGIEYDEANDLYKHQVSNEKQLIDILIHQRIDIAVGNKAVILRYAESKGVRSQIRFLSPAIDNGPNYIAFSKARNDAQQLSDEFSIALKKFIKTEEYRKILTKYHFDIP